MHASVRLSVSLWCLVSLAYRRDNDDDSRRGSTAMWLETITCIGHNKHAPASHGLLLLRYKLILVHNRPILCYALASTSRDRQTCARFGLHDGDSIRRDSRAIGIIGGRGFMRQEYGLGKCRMCTVQVLELLLLQELNNDSEVRIHITNWVLSTRLRGIGSI